MKTQQTPRPRSLSRLALLLAMIMSLSPLSDVSAHGKEDQLGAWYMYFWSWATEGGQDRGRLGLQGDIRYRNWDLGGDLEQLLLRGGLTYQPAQLNTKLTLGYAHITSGEFGEADDTVTEHRIYQEALVPQQLGSRLYLTHRYRYEQRFTDNPTTRTRFRYALFMNIALNQASLKQGALYLALYNEIFVNGERALADGSSVTFFDRNRAYAAIGYSLTDRIRAQFGYMQQTTGDVNKGQAQLSLHQAW